MLNNRGSLRNTQNRADFPINMHDLDHELDHDLDPDLDHDLDHDEHLTLLYHYIIMNIIILF